MTKKKITLIRQPRYIGAEDENCYWTLKVNGYAIGTYVGGTRKKYLDKNEWAEEMLKKRIPVIEQNIRRLKSEMKAFENELKALT